MPNLPKSACQEAIVKASEGRLNSDQAASLLREIEDKAKLNKLAQSLPEALAAAADEKAKSELFAALTEQRNKVINGSIKRRAYNVIKQNFGGDYLEGLVSMLGGSKTTAAHGRFNIDTNIKTLRGYYLGRLKKGLEDKGLLDLFASDKMEVEMAQALQTLETKGGDISTLQVSTQAKDMARIVHDVTREFVDRANRAGANIGSLEGFIAQQAHNPSELKRAAWDFRVLKPGTWSEFKRPDFNANRDAWVGEISNRLDLQKTFPDHTPEQIKERLNEDYGEFALGNHLKSEGADDYAGFSGYQNVAKKVSGHRSYHFKSAEDFVTYNKKFGTGSLKYSLVSRIDHMARNIALMEGLGTNPGSMLAELHKKFLDEAQASGDHVNAEKLKNKLGFLTNVMKQVDGSTNIPVDPSLAKWGSYVRNWTSLSRLGFVTPHSFGDYATISSRLKLQGIDISKTYLDTLSTAFQAPKGQRKEIANALGLAMQSFTGHLNKDWLADSGPHGFTSKMMDTYFRLNLLDRFDNANQSSIAWLLSNDLGKQSGKALADLSPELGNTLKQYGITDKHWDLYRDTKWTTDSGHDVLTSDRVYDIPKEKIEQAIRDEGRNPTSANIKRYYDELHTRVSSYVVDSADFAVPRPGARQQALLIQGTQRGTAIGEAVRFMAQFKPFQVSVYQKGLLPTMKSGNKLAMVNYFAGTLIAGYTGYAISDFLSGKKPKDITDPSTWADSLLKGGGLGPYGDYLFGNFDKDRHPVTATLLGPTLGQIEDAYGIFQKFKDELGGSEKADPFAAMVRFGQRNIPFQNLWFAKHILDRAIFWKVQEGLNPGSLRRMENSLQKQGQEYQDNAVFKSPTSSE